MTTTTSRALHRARIALAMLLSACAMLAGGVAHAQTCGTTSYPLRDDGGFPYGNITISNDSQNLYINYSLTHPGAAFRTLYAWAGNDISNVPYSASFGGPWPPAFPYVSGQGSMPSSEGATSYTFAIPFVDLLLTDVSGACGISLKIVHFASLKLDLDGDGVFDQSAIAWGGDTLVKDMRLWYYSDYKVCCDSGPPPVEKCETAFGKGNHVFVTEAKSNPEQLPTLGLTKNRWGWANRIAGPGTYVRDLWAGAGLNDTRKGTKVGTVTIDWDGAIATISYNVTAAGYALKEVHAYSGDARPATLAPGQYGNTGYLDTGARTASFTMPLADLDGLPGVWTIAHAVVCR